MISVDPMQTMKKALKILFATLVLIPFGLCVGFLLVLGKSLGLSYKQISVIFNLYLQGGLLLLSGVLPLLAVGVTMLDCPCVPHVLLTLMWGSYFSIYIVGFIWLIRHYHLPLEYSFDLCVADLQKVARYWHISYHATNLIIFVAWWLALVGVNVVMARCVYLNIPFVQM